MRADESLREREDVVALHERRLDVDLRELGLAVGAQVLVAEAARDLEIAVEPADHEQLLVDLRRLRQRVELAGVHAAGHEVVARALRRRLGEDRRLEFEESALAQVAPRHLQEPMAQHEVLPAARGGAGRDTGAAGAVLRRAASRPCRARREWPASRPARPPRSPSRAPRCRRSPSPRCAWQPCAPPPCPRSSPRSPRRRPPRPRCTRRSTSRCRTTPARSPRGRGDRGRRSRRGSASDAPIPRGGRAHRRRRRAASRRDACGARWRTGSG